MSSGLAAALAAVAGYGIDPRPFVFRPDISPSCYGSCECSALSLVASASRWLLLLLSPLLSTRRRPSSGKPTRTVQGMARVRSGQASAWPLSSDQSARRGSRVKRDFTCTFTRHFSPVLVALRSQSRLRLEGRTRTLGGPSPGLSPAGTLATFRPLTLSLGPCSATHYEPVSCVTYGFGARCVGFMGCCCWRSTVVDGRFGASRGMSGRSPGWL